MTLLSHLSRVDGIRNGEFSAPVMADVTPVDGTCNLDCVWCCQAHSRRSRTARFMDHETIRRIGPFCREWGILAWRISGEADPCLHRSISSLIESGRRAGLDIGLITNGVFLERIENPEDLDYLGISLDAATAETWHRFKGGQPGDFEKIIDNVAAVRSKCPSLDISIKFLRVDDQSLTEDEFGSSRAPGGREPLGSNRGEIEQAGELAERLGVRFILKTAYTTASRPQFARCLVTPLGGVFDAYHHFHLCCDARGRYLLTTDYTRDDWAELPRIWGSEKHKELISSIRPQSCVGCAKIGMNAELDSYFRGHQVNFI